jgi:phosphoribosyl 1,2-cyclic phosphodiesterase
LKTAQDAEARRMRDRYYNYKQSSLLIEYDTHQVRIDAGDEWQGDLQIKKYDALILTHSHPDHSYGLREFRDSEVPFPIMSHKPTLIDLKKRFQMKGDMLELPQTIGELEFDAVKVNHSKLTPTIAIKFNQIIYAPDYLRFLEPEKLRGAKLLIADGSSLRRDIKRSGDVGHASIESTLITADKFNIRTVIITHVGHVGIAYNDFNLAVGEMGKKYGIRTRVARDGMKIDFPDYYKTAKSSSNLSIETNLFCLEDYDPSRVTDKQLGDHLRLVAAKYATMRQGDETEFKTIDEVINFATRIMEESFKQDKMRYHWDKLKPFTRELMLRVLPRLAKRAIYLTEPHGQLLMNGIKTAMIKPKDLDIANEPLGIISGNKLYGYVRLKAPKNIDHKTFKELFEDHRISQQEKIKLWPRAKEFYLYPVRDRFALLKPKTVRVRAGTQTFVQLMKHLDKIDIFNIDPIKLANISDIQLITLHGKIHDAFAQRGSRMSDELIINSHQLIIDELHKRKLEHRALDVLDKTLSVLNKIPLEALQRNLTDIVVKEPFLAMIGGTVISGRGTDLDIWINWTDNSAEKLIDFIKYRLKSVLPEEFKDRIHMVPSTDGGPITSYIPLADLEVRFKPPEAWKLVRMAADKIEPGKFFAPMKTSATAYHKGEFFSPMEAYKKWARIFLEK